MYFLDSGATECTNDAVSWFHFNFSNISVLNVTSLAFEEGFQSRRKSSKMASSAPSIIVKHLIQASIEDREKNVGSYDTQAESIFSDAEKVSPKQVSSRTLCRVPIRRLRLAVEYISLHRNQSQITSFSFRYPGDRSPENQNRLLRWHLCSSIRLFFFDPASDDDGRTDATPKGESGFRRPNPQPPFRRAARRSQRRCPRIHQFASTSATRR